MEPAAALTDHIRVQVDAWHALIPIVWPVLALLVVYASKAIMLQELLVLHAQATVSPAIARLAIIVFLPIRSPTEPALSLVQESAWPLTALELPLLVTLDVIPAQLETTKFSSVISSLQVTPRSKERSSDAILHARHAATAQLFV